MDYSKQAAAFFGAHPSEDRVVFTSDGMPWLEADMNQARAHAKEHGYEVQSFQREQEAAGLPADVTGSEGAPVEPAATGVAGTADTQPGQDAGSEEQVGDDAGADAVDDHLAANAVVEDKAPADVTENVQGPAKAPVKKAKRGQKGGNA